jgi:hypothetical protein
MNLTSGLEENKQGFKIDRLNISERQADFKLA